MDSIRELQPRRKEQCSHSFNHELPAMIQTIEREWGRQTTAGTYSFHQRLWLQQAHVALASLLEMQEEAV